MNKSLEALDTLVKWGARFEPKSDYYYDLVKRDLEVLEIIKDKLVVANIILNGKTYHTISIPKEINKLTENQYEKIEEWLEND